MSENSRTQSSEAVSEASTESAPEYWHVLSSYAVESDVFATATLGPTTLGPDETTPNGTVVREITAPHPLGEDYPEFTYVTTLTYAPTPADLDPYAPVGHRTWERDDLEESDPEPEPTEPEPTEPEPTEPEPETESDPEGENPVDEENPQVATD